MRIANMKLISKGKKKSDVFRGKCEHCGAFFEAERSELSVERWRNNEELARHDCSECGGKNSIIFYPAKD